MEAECVGIKQSLDGGAGPDNVIGGGGPWCVGQKAVIQCGGIKHTGRTARGPIASGAPEESGTIGWGPGESCGGGQLSDEQDGDQRGRGLGFEERRFGDRQVKSQGLLAEAVRNEARHELRHGSVHG